MITSMGDQQKSAWLENYVKHDIKSKGVGIPEIRQVVKAANHRYHLSSKPFIKQVELLNDLMQKDFTEDKLAAIIYLELFWKKENPKLLLELVSGWFDKGWISDWNVGDWLCVRILTPLIDESPEVALPELKQWNKSPSLWKARASLVPFAEAKSINMHVILIEKFSAELIRREERFCKTAVGWVLREYSKHDRKFVENFLEENKKWTTKEVIQNASKYFD